MLRRCSHAGQRNEPYQFATLNSVEIAQELHDSVVDLCGTDHGGVDQVA